jgi:hypothetical protein
MFSSDLPGVNPATLNEMILYYRLMTKWSGLGDSMELSRMGLSQSHIEDLPKVSNIIAFSFFVTLRCCLYSTYFSLMSKIESTPRLYSIAQCTKFPFQQVFICPNRTPNKRVTFVSLRRWNLSWNFRTRNAQCFLHNSLHGSSNLLVLDTLEWKFDGPYEYIIFFILTLVNNL